MGAKSTTYLVVKMQAKKYSAYIIAQAEINCKCRNLRKWTFVSITIHDTVGAPLAAPEICDILGRSKRRPYS